MTAAPESTTTELTESPGFRVTELRVENFMRLTAVDITPDGTVQVIEGANAQGKSSVLDALWYALASGNAQRGKTEIIHQGARKAKVRVTLSDGTQTAVVERTWSSNGQPGTLKLTDEHGTPYSKPREVLDSLINDRCFDPLAYANSSPADQRAGLLSVVDLPFDPDKLEAERKALYEQRTDVNRDVKRLEVQVDSLPLPAPGTPDAEVSVAGLAEQYRKGTLAAEEVKAVADTVGRWQKRVDEIEAQLTEARANLEQAKTAHGMMTARPLPDLEAIQAQMASAEAVNTAVRAKAQREAAAAELATAAAESHRLTAAIEAIDERKTKALAAAAMPLPGLGFDEDGVTYQGLPFSQASGAERLRVSAAMAIAANPAVRTMIVKDGPLLDDDGMALLTDIARRNDFQVIIERVYSGGERTGVLIVDGQVADDGPGPVPTAATGVSTEEAAKAVSQVTEITRESEPTAAGAFDWLNPGASA